MTDQKNDESSSSSKPDDQQAGFGPVTSAANAFLSGIGNLLGKEAGKSSLGASTKIVDKTLGTDIASSDILDSFPDD